MYKITDSMIHPELRKKAKSLRNKSQTYSVKKAKLLKTLCGLLRGQHSRKIRYRQEYIIRPAGSKLRICVYTPLVKREGACGLLWIHGGGYAIGVPEQDDHFIREFVGASGCVVVSPDYALSVDKPYPAALDDCYATLLWLCKNGGAFGMRQDQIFVGGDSAGGGLAAAVSLYARDKGDAAVAFQILAYPMLDDRPTSSSTGNDAPVWDSVSNNAAWRMYLGDCYGGDNVPAYAAPARAKNFAGLPPACCFVGSIEAFYDETVTYIENLKKSGVPVQFKVFDGCYHAFVRMCPNANIAKEAISFLMENFMYAVNNYFAPQRSKA
jgi:acetyl esterase/lipase